MFSLLKIFVLVVIININLEKDPFNHNIYF